MFAQNLKVIHWGTCTSKIQSLKSFVMETKLSLCYCVVVVWSLIKCCCFCWYESTEPEYFVCNEYELFFTNRLSFLCITLFLKTTSLSFWRYVIFKIKKKHFVRNFSQKCFRIRAWNFTWFITLFVNKYNPRALFTWKWFLNSVSCL